MTEAELILADLVLLKLPVNREFTQRGAYNGVLLGKQDDYDQDTLAKMNNVLTSENSIIIDFLLKEKYINCTNQMHGRFMLSDEGEEAQRQGGHKQYLEWAAIEKRKKEFEEFPKKKWHIYEPIKWLLFLVGGIAIERYILKGCDQYKSQETEKVSEQPTSPQLPKTSNNTNGVYELDSNHYKDNQVKTKYIDTTK